MILIPKSRIKPPTIICNVIFSSKKSQAKIVAKTACPNKDKETLKLRRRYTLMAIEMWEGSPDTHERKEYNIDYFKKELEIIDKELEKLQSKTI